MKTGERSVYVALTEACDCNLCSFCRYNQGGACDGELCTHPLSEYSHFPLSRHDYLEPGQDCWAFRTPDSVEYVAEIVGVILSAGFEEWLVSEKDGRIVVYGRTARQLFEASR